MTRQEVEGVVDKLDRIGMLRKSRITGNWYTIYCPFHNNGNEKKPSCGILLQDEVRNGSIYKAGTSHCFTCGFSRDLRSTVAELLKVKHVSIPVKDWIHENVPELDDEAVSDIRHPEEYVVQHH